MVDDAMRSMNFSKLNQDIGRTVNQALEEVQVATEYGRSEAYL